MSKRTFEFQTCDVFTEQAFGGNQLAVFLNAEGLSDEEMQQLANEIGYAETTFVLPPDDPANTARVRIFTPAYEMPFAGHPNIGTAHLMALEAIANGVRPDTMLFEEIAGIVKIDLAWDGDELTNVMLTAPQALEHKGVVDRALAARMAGVDVSDLNEHWNPCAASTGATFTFVEVSNYEALKKATTDISAHKENAASVGVLAFCLVDENDVDAKNIDVRTRMFAPEAGIIEDAATGSANITLAGLLAEIDAEKDGLFTYHIAQGVEMGRPSLLIAEAQKTKGKVKRLKIGGMTVPMFKASVEL